jgi:hypothetical protein
MSESDPKAVFCLLCESLALADAPSTRRVYVLTNHSVIEYEVDGGFEHDTRTIPLSSLTALMTSTVSLELVLKVRSDRDVFVVFDSEVARQYFMTVLQRAVKTQSAAPHGLPHKAIPQPHLIEHAAVCFMKLGEKLRGEAAIADMQAEVASLDDVAANYVAALAPSADGGHSRFDFLWKPSNPMYCTEYLRLVGEREAHVAFSSEIELPDGLLFATQLHLVATARALYVFKTREYTPDGLVRKIKMDSVTGFVVSAFHPRIVLKVRSEVDYYFAFPKRFHFRLPELVKLIKAAVAALPAGGGMGGKGGAAVARAPLDETRVDEEDLSASCVTEKTLEVKLSDERANEYFRLQQKLGGSRLNVEED